ncbi:sugar transferase [bacterium]|nr:sugar transferase [bacterium]
MEQERANGKDGGKTPAAKPEGALADAAAIADRFAAPIYDWRKSPYVSRLFESRLKDEEKRRLVHFGHDLFAPRDDVDLVLENMPAVPGYVIGPGDEVVVRMWGRMEGTERLTVDRDGKIFFPKLGSFHVAGKTFEELKAFLRGKVSGIKEVRSDVAGALAGLGLTVLLFPFIALAIRLDSPGPLFFRQVRVGENGRLFTCWKFRSMYRDAERRKGELIPLNEMSGAIFKMRNDPRVTRVGRFLRRTSLDELPQFWNVLLGEMSLVGTRPPTPEEVTGYGHRHRKRICIKPGITGLWQVSGRNDIRDFDEVVRLDIEYIDQWSLWLDVKILMKTFRVLLARNGAY